LIVHARSKAQQNMPQAKLNSHYQEQGSTEQIGTLTITTHH
jgi:hypothetical protein